jgi:hypothetical protein
VVGTAIEAPDPSALAKFYSELLGWPIGHEEPGTAIVAAPQGSIYIVFQQATDYRAPVWPHERSAPRSGAPAATHASDAASTAKASPPATPRYCINSISLTLKPTD